MKYFNDELDTRATWSTHLYYAGLSRKGGMAMNVSVTVDWKFVVALGAAAAGTIFAVKMDSSEAERVSTHAIDACKEVAIAVKGNC